MDDGEAIRRLKRGDICGLEDLIARYQVEALHAAFLITQDQALAEDVVQDMFVRLYERIHQFDASQPLEPYLMRSVVNRALNAVRHENKSFSADPDDLDALVHLLARAPSVESEVELGQLRDEVRIALGKLGPRQRTVVVERYYLGMSEREIALDLDAPVGTIKWLLSAARARLHALLARERKAE